MKHFIWAGIVVSSFLGLMACTSQENDHHVSIILNGMTDTTTVTIATTNVYSLKDTILAEFRIDSAGHGVLKFPIEKPSYAHLSIGKTTHTLYLEPGYDLALSPDASKGIHFTGTGSEPNNYLVSVARIREQSENAGGKTNHSLSNDAFLARNDSTTKRIESFHQHYTDSVAMPDHVKAFLAKRNTIIRLERIQNIGWNYAAERGDFDLPEELDVVNEIPKDSSLMSVGLANYALLVHMNMYLEFFNHLPIAKDEIAARGDEAPLMVMKMINETQYPEFYKEYLHVKNVDYWMASTALTHQLDSTYHIIKQRFPNSKGLPVLDARYNRWLTIAKGKPAPDFTGFTPDGKKISFHDLKGKVVYVDVWATWCGPCREEIPFAKKTMKRFSKVDDVVFLYISIDLDREAWKKMVREDKTWPGTHIIDMEKPGTSSLWDSYMVWGIPRYMLIDQDGNMVAATALRPSSGSELDNQIRILLPPEKQKLVALDVL